MPTSNRTYSIQGPDKDQEFTIVCDGEPILTPNGNPIRHSSKRLLDEVVTELEAEIPGPEAHTKRMLDYDDPQDVDDPSEIKYQEARQLGPPWIDRRFKLSYYVLICYQLDCFADGIDTDWLVPDLFSAKYYLAILEPSLRNLSYQQILSSEGPTIRNIILNCWNRSVKDHMTHHVGDPDDEPKMLKSFDEYVAKYLRAGKKLHDSKFIEEFRINNQYRPELDFSFEASWGEATYYFDPPRSEIQELIDFVEHFRYERWQALEPLKRFLSASGIAFPLIDHSKLSPEARLVETSYPQYRNGFENPWTLCDPWESPDWWDERSLDWWERRDAGIIFPPEGYAHHLEEDYFLVTEINRDYRGRFTKPSRVLKYVHQLWYQNESDIEGIDNASFVGRSRKRGPWNPITSRCARMINDMPHAEKPTTGDWKEIESLELIRQYEYISEGEFDKLATFLCEQVGNLSREKQVILHVASRFTGDGTENFWYSTELGPGGISGLLPDFAKSSNSFTGSCLLTLALMSGECTSREYARAVLANYGVLRSDPTYKVPRKAPLVDGVRLKFENKEVSYYEVEGVSHDGFMDDRDYLELVKGISEDAEIFMTYIELAGDQIQDLIAEGENYKLEFKSTLRRNLSTGKNDNNIQLAALKEIVGFLNADGGTLLIGVNDDGNICGIEEDNLANQDKYTLHLSQLINSHIDSKVINKLSMRFHSLGGKQILQVDCPSVKEPKYLDGEYYLRTSSQTKRLSGKELVEHLSNKTTDG